MLYFVFCFVVDMCVVFELMCRCVRNVCFVCVCVVVGVRVCVVDV